MHVGTVWVPQQWWIKSFMALYQISDNIYISPDPKQAGSQQHCYVQYHASQDPNKCSMEVLFARIGYSYTMITAIICVICLRLIMP